MNESYSNVREDERLYDMALIKNSLKKAGALSSLLFHFALEYVIKRVQINQDGLKLSGTHHLLGYIDYVNTPGGKVHTIKRNAETVVGASKEIGLE